jgi:glycine cleavage system aminomethyltransferase T
LCATAAVAERRTGAPGWLPWVQAEMRATREGVALYDQSPFARLLLQGRDALAVLQRACANDVDVVPGRMVYGAVLNARGGFESDLTVMRLPPERGVDRFLSPARRRARDADRIARQVGILIGHQPVGELSSAGWSLAAGRCIGLGHVRGEATQRVHAGTPVQIELWGQVIGATAWDEPIARLMSNGR